MSKQEFLARLRKGLSGLPQSDVEERLTFYSEMIDDRTEEGFSEEEAVAAVGAVEDIVAQITADIPFVKIAKERLKPKRRLNAWTIVLLVIGSPIWLSLGIAVLAVVLTVYISLWTVIVSLWAVFASLVACAVGGAAASVVFACGGHGYTSVAMLATTLVCAGLSVFWFFGCHAASKGIVKLTKLFALWTKSIFIKKEEAV